MLLDRGEHFTRCLRVLGGDRSEIEPEDPVRFEEHLEAFRVGDPAVDRAALKPRDRSWEIQIVGERASERFHPPFAQGGLGRLSLWNL